MPEVVNESVSIHYEVIGAGPPLVLQHGFMQSTRRWHFHGYVDALKSDCRLILIDARGHGQSDEPYDRAAYQSPVMAPDVLAVLDALGLEKVRCWGFSMGARTGFELAGIAPERLAAAILGGSHPYAREQPPGTADGSDPEAFIQLFFASLGVDPDSPPAAIRADILRNDFRALVAARRDRPSVEAALANLVAPTLIYAGDADPIHRDAQRCVSELPNAAFVSLAGLDHAATFRAAERMLPRACEFLAAIE